MDFGAARFERFTARVIRRRLMCARLRVVPRRRSTAGHGARPRLAQAGLQPVQHKD
jgi:hypothetical protein